jgi:hypothetical protein
MLYYYDTKQLLKVEFKNSLIEDQLKQIRKKAIQTWRGIALKSAFKLHPITFYSSNILHFSNNGRHSISSCNYLKRLAKAHWMLMCKSIALILVGFCKLCLTGYEIGNIGESMFTLSDIFLTSI